MSESKSNKVDSATIALRSDLDGQRNKFLLASLNHKRHEKFYNKVNIMMGFPMTLILLLATFLGAVQAKGAASLEPINIVILVLNAIGSVLSASIVFFKIPTKMSRHHAASGQYSDLAKDLRAFLVRHPPLDDLEEQATVILEKEKFIDGYKPNLGALGCLHVLTSLDSVEV